MDMDHKFHEHSERRNADNVDEQTLEKASRFFKVLSDPERLKLLLILAEGEACVSELATKDQMSTVSQRLKVLKSENLVTRSRKGKHMIYRLADQHVYILIKNAIEHAEEK